MNDIANRARELIENLTKNGFKGFVVADVSPSCEDNWSEHYACIDGLYVDTMDIDEDAAEYFDYAKLDYDFEYMMRDWFTFDDEKTQLVRSYQHDVKDSDFDSKDGLIMVRYRGGCHELEVYRLIGGKIPGGDDDA